MADEPTKTPGSITQQADNSNERISEISNINRTISNMQKKIDQQLGETSKEVGNSEAISSVQNSMTKVLQKLSVTVADIGKGFGKISIDVAKSGKDVISQYGRAIGQDINYNKQNIVAMALSKSTPIYGYFISKFMETDVWKTASARMKENIGRTLSSVGQKLKNVIGDLKFGKKSKKDTDSLSKQTRSIKVPHMAKGGVVEKAGLAKLHAAEVVMPIDKLLSRMDDQISVTKTMAKTVHQGQLHSMSKLNSYVGSLEQYQKTGLIKGFFNALKEVQTQYEEPQQQRVLRALLAIQDALGAQVGNWTQVWQKMLIQHPVFRNAMVMGDLLRRTLAAPFAPVYAIFKQRGGYVSQLSSSSSPLEALNENIGILYTGSMFRMDAIATYTKATAEATRDLSSMITGSKYEALPGIKTGRWSIFGMVRKFLNMGTKFLIESLGKIISIPMAQLGPKFDKLAEILTKQRGTSKRGFDKYLDDLYGGGTIKKGTEMFGMFFPPAMSNIISKQNAIPIINIDREKIEDTSKKLLQISDKNLRTDLKDFNLSKNALKYAKANLKENKETNERGRRQSLFGFLSGGFGAIKGLLGSAMGFMKPLLTGGLGGVAAGGIGGLAVSIITAAPVAALIGSIAAGITLEQYGRDFFEKIFGKTGPDHYKGVGPGRGKNYQQTEKEMEERTEAIVKDREVSAKKWAERKTKLENISKTHGKGRKPFTPKETTGIMDKLKTIKDNITGLTSNLFGRGMDIAKKQASKAKELAYDTVPKIKDTAINLASKAYDETASATKAIKDSTVGLASKVRDVAKKQTSETKELIYHTAPKMKNDVLTSISKVYDNTALASKALKDSATGITSKAYDQTAVATKAIKDSTTGIASKAYNIAKEKSDEAAVATKALTEELKANTAAIKDSAIGLASRTHDVAKQKVNETMLTTKALTEALKTNTAEAIDASKKAAVKVGDAINQNTAIVSNTINNTSTAVTNAGRGVYNNIEDQYNRHLMRGDVDGD